MSENFDGDSDLHYVDFDADILCDCGRRESVMSPGGDAPSLGGDSSAGRGLREIRRFQDDLSVPPSLMGAIAATEGFLPDVAVAATRATFSPPRTILYR